MLPPTFSFPQFQELLKQQTEKNSLSWPVNNSKSIKMTWEFDGQQFLQ